MGFREYVVKKKEQFDAYAERQRINTEQRRMSQDLQSKLDRESLAIQASEARKELASLKKSEKDKKAISQLQEYKKKSRNSGIKSVGSLFSDFDASRNNFGFSSSGSNDIFGSMFGSAPKKKSKKRTKRRK